MPRVGAIWDPAGDGIWWVRASYGLFYDQFQNGPDTPSQVAISATPWAHFNRFSGAGLNFQTRIKAAPCRRRTRLSAVRLSSRSIPRPSASVQNWNAGVQRSIAEKYPVEVRYVGAAGTNLPRNVKANPAVYAPGATRRRRPATNLRQRPADGSACDYSTIAMLRNITNSSYQAGQASVSRRLAERSAFNVASYWYSRTSDHLSAMNLSGAAAKPLAGENDFAQNPFDLNAEYGRRSSTRDIASWPSAELGNRRSSNGPSVMVRAIFGGWQLKRNRHP